MSETPRCRRVSEIALSHANFSLLHEPRELRGNYARIDWGVWRRDPRVVVAMREEGRSVCVHTGEIWFCCRLTILNYLLGGPRRNICRGESAPSRGGYRLPPPSARYVVRGCRQAGFTGALGLGVKMTAYSLSGMGPSLVLCTRGEISGVLKFSRTARHFYQDSPPSEAQIKWLCSTEFDLQLRRYRFYDGGYFKRRLWILSAWIPR